MDLRQENENGHTSAGEFGCPSAGVGGVVAQAPPTSLSDVCELGRADLLASQDANATREDSRLSAAVAGPSTAGGGRPRRKKIIVRQKRDETPSFSAGSTVDDTSGSEKEVDITGWDSSVKEFPKMVLKDDAKFPDLKKMFKKELKKIHKKKEYIKAKIKKRMPVISDSSPEDTHTTPMDDLFMDDYDLEMAYSTENYTDLEEENEESEYDTENDEGLRTYRMQQEIDKLKLTKIELEKNIAICMDKTTEYSKFEEELKLINDQIDRITLEKKKLDDAAEIEFEKGRAEDLERQKREEEEENKRQLEYKRLAAIWAKEKKEKEAKRKQQEQDEAKKKEKVSEIAVKSLQEENESASRIRELDKKEDRDIVETKKEERTIKDIVREIKEKYKKLAEEAVDTSTDKENWLTNKDIPTETWTSDGASPPPVASTSKDVTFPLPVASVSKDAASPLPVASTSRDTRGEVVRSTSPMDVDLFVQPISSRNIAKKKPVIKKITKIQAKTQVPIDTRHKIAVELKRLHSIIIDLSQYIQSNKNMRISYKDICARLPNTLQNIIKMNESLNTSVDQEQFKLKNIPVVDASSMTSPPLQVPLVGVDVDSDLPERNRNQQKSVSYAEIVKDSTYLQQKKMKASMKSGKKKRKKIKDLEDESYSHEFSTVDTNTADTNTADNTMDEDVETDLDKMDELLHMNVKLLEKNRELRSHIVGLKNINKYILDTEIQFKDLKNSGGCQPDKLACTEEIIKTMKKVVGRYIDQKKYSSESIVKTSTEIKDKDLVNDWKVMPNRRKSKIDLAKTTPVRIDKRLDLKTNRPRWSIKRPDAIMITTADETMYKKVYNNLSSRSATLTNKIKRVRKSRLGHMVIEVADSGNTLGLKRDIYDALEEGTEIRTLQKMFDLEVRDIDSMITKEQIVITVANHIGAELEDVQVKTVRNTRIGTQVAVISTPTRLIDTCLAKDSVKIGFSIAKLSPAPKIVKCYRCHDIGHYSGNCMAKLDGDMKCRNCGQEGHIHTNAVPCTRRLKCWICALNKEQDFHLTGSMACPRYRQIVAKQKAQLRRNYLIKFNADKEKKEKDKGKTTSVKMKGNKKVDKQLLPQSGSSIPGKSMVKKMQAIYSSSDSEDNLEFDF